MTFLRVTWSDADMAGGCVSDAVQCGERTIAVRYDT